jgi:hypothetical protein
MWADGDLQVVVWRKYSDLGTRASGDELLRSTEVRDFPKENWATGLCEGITPLSVLLWELFTENKISPGLRLTRTEVKHRQFTTHP